jgi:predicted Zn-dependent peptidase
MPASLVKQASFPNGFRIIYQKSKNTLPITSIQTYCDLGSFYENDKVRGVSHFIEHMCFKGTKQLPTYATIYRQYDNIGAYFNASTYKRYTEYSVKCQDDHFDNSVAVMADILLNSTFNRTEFEKEHKVVIEENVKDSDDYDVVMSDMVDKLVYQGTPYEYPVDIVEYHTKKSLKYEDVVAIYKIFYQPNNMVISIVSNLPFSTVLRTLKKTDFYKKQTHDLMILDRYKEVRFQPPIQLEPRYTIKRVNTNVSRISIAFRTCSRTSPDKYVLNLLKKAMAGFFSSRLFTLLREENGLTYSSWVSTEYFENMGQFVISAVMRSDKLLKNGNKKGVLPLIVDLINDLIHKGITPAELRLTKHYMKGQTMIHMEDVDNTAVYNGQYVLLDSATIEYVKYENVYSTYFEPITREQVKQIVQKYFIKKNMSVCVLGDIHSSAKQIREECEKIVL